MLHEASRNAGPAWAICTVLIEKDNLSSPAGQLAKLWGLFAPSHLLYNLEVQSAIGASALKRLEITQAMAGNLNIIVREAILGDHCKVG